MYQGAGISAASTTTIASSRQRRPTKRAIATAATVQSAHATHELRGPEGGAERPRVARVGERPDAEPERQRRDEERHRLRVEHRLGLDRDRQERDERGRAERDPLAARPELARDRATSSTVPSRKSTLTAMPARCGSPTPSLPATQSTEPATA